MMTKRAWSFGDDRQVSATAMITTRAVPALLPHITGVSPGPTSPLNDFADPLNGPAGALEFGPRRGHTL